MFHPPHHRAGWSPVFAGVVLLAVAALLPLAEAAGDDVAAASPELFNGRAGADSSAAGGAESSADADSSGGVGEDTPLPVPAQEQRPLGIPSGGGAPTESSPTGSGSWALQTLAALAIVIALIFVMRSLLMRLSGTRAAGASRLVEVLARTTIGHKTQVVFLKINQRVIVAAQTPAGIDTLTVMDEPEEVAWLLGEVEAAKPMSITQSFRHVMQRFDKDFNAGAESGTDRSEQYVDRTRDELSGLLARIRHLKDRPGPGGER